MTSEPTQHPSPAGSARPARIGAPLLALLAAALCLHAYQCFVLASEPAPGFFAWLFVPYLVALLFLVKSASPLPAIAGAGVAFVMDVVLHYAVFVEPASSTAALGLIFFPLASALLFVPVCGLLTRLALRTPSRG